jgi:RND family efflux transporter MFP subunit
MRALVIVLVSLVACGTGGGAPADETESSPAQVRCESVKAATITDAVALRGAVAPPPLAESVVASTVAGRIAKLLVEEGDLVVATQLVAQVEDPTLGASATEMNAEVDAGLVELRSATTERARSEKLFADGIVAQKEVDDARAREDAARAHVRVAQSRSGLARRQLGRTDLRAPRAGTVLRVFKRAGELLDAADASIAEIADLSVLELRAQVTGAEMIGLAPGTPAVVDLDAMPGMHLAGEVAAVSPAMDPATSLGTVRVTLTLPPGWRPAIGLTGAATVRRAPRDGLLIPVTAIRRSIAGADEVLVCAGDHVEVREVAIGAREPATVEVRGGVAAGERLVVDHVLGLEDGAAIAEAPAR